MNKHNFHVVPKSAQSEGKAESVRQRLRSQRQAEIISCHRCAGIEVIETRIGMRVEDGKRKGGTKVLVCAGCLMTGFRVVIG